MVAISRLSPLTATFQKSRREYQIFDLWKCEAPTNGALEWASIEKFFGFVVWFRRGRVCLNIKQAYRVGQIVENKDFLGC